MTGRERGCYYCLGLWVPAFAGTTAEQMAFAGATAQADRANALSIMFTALPMP